jgi:rhamnose transport system ATP-binding protein
MRPVVSLQNIRKSFGGTRALEGVSLDIVPGEVHALVGENGAGKSTLINVLSGVVRADAGALVVEGAHRSFQNPQDAKSAGIATVFQELSLVDGLSVAENICAGQPPSRFGLVDRSEQRARAAQAMALLGVSLPPDAPVGRLMASQRQLVEIAKALDQLVQRNGPDRAVRVLVLDEPTSALNADEKAALFSAIRKLRGQGLTVVYISHHLDEVLALADRITVLRDGANVWTGPAAGLDAEMLVRAMVGRRLERTLRPPRRAGEELARLEHVSRFGKIEDVSLSLLRGEILAVAGLEGSGRETVGRLFAGLERADRGRVTLYGRSHAGSLRAAMAMGLAYIPDDRKTLGLFLDLPIAENVAASDLAGFARWGLMRQEELRVAGADLIRRYAVKADSPLRRVGALSGGNQQKVLFGKWLRRNPSMLIVEEPTKGVDVRAKRDIHDEIRARAQAGAAVLVASSDLPEILELADRIVVLNRGRVAGILEGASASEEAVMSLASQKMAEAA